MLPLSRLLMLLGLIIFVVGGLLYLGNRFDIPLGRLPGDIRIERDNFSFYFPITTMILISILLTVGLNLINRFLSK
jgi:formate hydrogenlyase subunit 3/multisubunit Na+/H+ antiporter MnhD subunit